MTNYVLALDQGTTSSRAILFDRSGRIINTVQQEFPQIYPQAGWVEHGPEAIWGSQLDCARGVLESANVRAHEVAAIGITNQRETTIVWDRRTGQAIHNAIVWQDTRTDAICNELAKDGGQDRFRDKVGLPLATYFSGPKIKWILDNVEGVRAKAEKGELLFGCHQAGHYGGGMVGKVTVS